MRNKYVGILLSAVLVLIFYTFFEIFIYYDNKLHVIFCDVGQGDGILIKTPKGKIAVADAGSDDKILSCLQKHLPFWQKSVDLFLLSHPHLDHFNGFTYILQRYKASHFITERLSNNIESYKSLMIDIKSKNIKQTFAYAGDKLVIDNVSINFLAPTKEFVSQTSPKGNIGETKEFASLISLISYGKFSLLLTGDSQSRELTDAARGIAVPLQILQVPHHGSRTGITKELLSGIAPAHAIISVGKKNRYGHPSSVVLLLLKEEKIPITRTDEHGDIEIITDGKTWSIN